MEVSRGYDYMTYDEYLRYTSNLRKETEYSDGEMFYTSPIHELHRRAEDRMYFKMDQFLKHWRVYNAYYKNFTMYSHKAVKFSDGDIVHLFRPDIMVVADNNFDGSNYIGTPVLIVEIIGKSTRNRDLGIKLDVYEKFGVNEYWIIDIDNKEITTYNNNKNGRYMNKRIHSESDNIRWYLELITIKGLFD